MLDKLFGSANKERVLIYLLARRRGHPREIARFFNSSHFPIQRAMDHLEAAGVLVSRSVGRAREYQFNPRYPALAELEKLLNRALDLYPAAMRSRLQLTRTRPRRKGKPL